MLVQKPWCDGVIYIQPRQNFNQEAPQQIIGAQVHFPHWISKLATKPVAKIMVGPQDFPFLDQIHGHNDEKLVEIYSSNPGVFPIGALESLEGGREINRRKCRSLIDNNESLDLGMSLIYRSS